jgi:hypothetical protein
MIDLDPGQPRRRPRRLRSDRPDERHGAQLRRDAALRRVARLRHGAIVCAAGLTAALAGLVADVAPGKSYSAKRVAGGTALGAGANPVNAAAALPPLATARQLGLTAAPTAAAPGVVSARGASSGSASSSGSSDAGSGGGSSTVAVAPVSTPALAPPTPAAAPAPVVQAPAPAVQPAVVSGGS